MDKLTRYQDFPQLYALPHQVGVSCSNCGHMAYIDKNRKDNRPILCLPCKRIASGMKASYYL